jgi:hypothetical protein
MESKPSTSGVPWVIAKRACVWLGGAIALVATRSSRAVVYQSGRSQCLRVRL